MRMPRARSTVEGISAIALIGAGCLGCYLSRPIQDSLFGPLAYPTIRRPLESVPDAFLLPRLPPGEYDVWVESAGSRGVPGNLPLVVFDPTTTAVIGFHDTAPSV